MKHKFASVVMAVAVIAGVGVATAPAANANLACPRCH